MKMKFVKVAEVIVDGVPQTMFNEGDVQDLNPASAERWRRRGIAVDYVEGPHVVEAAAAGEKSAAESGAAATESDSGTRAKKPRK